MDKPDVFPDYVTPWGSAFWWQDMVYMSATGKFYKFYMDTESGNLTIDEGTQQTPLHRDFRKLYDKWMVDLVDKSLLGDNNDT